MNTKAGKKIVPVRAPDEVEAWARKQAEYDGSSLSAVFVRAARKEMEADAKQKARAEIASAGAP